MIEIKEVIIISIDKSDDIWAIEGEVIFENNLTDNFFVNYDTKEDELINIELEIDPGKYNKDILKEFILKAANNFEE